MREEPALPAPLGVRHPLSVSLAVLPWDEPIAVRAFSRLNCGPVLCGLVLLPADVKKVSTRYEPACLHAQKSCHLSPASRPYSLLSCRYVAVTAAPGSQRVT